MTPVLVHRYKVSIEIVLEQLLGKQAAGEGWEISIDGDDLVIDIHGPEIATSNETAKSNVAPAEADAAPAEPPRKGGPLAQRAAIACGEKGFWTFVSKKYGVAIQSADEAATWLKAQCGVTSRVDFDYDEGKAANFREIDKTYRLWLEGYD